MLLLAGCGGPVKVEQVKVAGTVLFHGKPLPGGVVTFVAPSGYTGTATIGEDGKYQTQVPSGDLKIKVDNRMLQKSRSDSHVGGPPKGIEGADSLKPMKGTYVPIPEKYQTEDSSGLTYKATKDNDNYDIKLE